MFFCFPNAFGEIANVYEMPSRECWKGSFATDDNAKALEHVELALMYLNKRVMDRYERNVLGTYDK